MAGEVEPLQRARRSRCADRAARRTRTVRRRIGGCTRARSSPRRAPPAARGAARGRGSPSTITLSTTERSMSGMSDGDQRGAQRHAEGDEHLPLVPGEERPQPTDPARCFTCASAPCEHARSPRGVRRARRAIAPSAARTAIGVVDPPDHIVEARAHRRLGRERVRRARRSVTLQAEGAPVVVDRRPGTSPRSTSVSMVADTVGLVSASWPASQAGPLRAAGDHGQQPVLGQGESRCRTARASGPAGRG